MSLVSSRISENPPKSLWRQGRPAGGRIHSAFDRAAPLHPRPWRRSYGGAATGCTPCVFGTLPKCKHSALWGKNKNSGSSSRIFLLVSSPSGSQEPQKLKHQNVRKSSQISPPLSAGIRELSDTRTHERIFWTTPAWSDVWSQRSIYRANMHEVTGQTEGADNHRSPVQSSCISKLKMGR